MERGVAVLVVHGWCQHQQVRIPVQVLSGKYAILSPFYAAKLWVKSNNKPAIVHESNDINAYVVEAIFATRNSLPESLKQWLYAPPRLFIHGLLSC